MRQVVKTILVICGIIAMLQTKTYAYTSSDYHHDSDVWYLDSIHNSGPNEITLFLLLNAEENYSADLVNYEFECIDGTFDGTIATYTMVYQFRLSSENKIATIQAGDIYAVSFRVESGTYFFGSMNKIHPIGFDFISTDANSNYLKFDELQTVTLTGNDTQRIYAISGDYQWAKESYTEFIQWSQEKETDLNPSFVVGEKQIPNRFEQYAEENEMVTPVEIDNSEIIIKETKEELEKETEEEELEKFINVLTKITYFIGLALIWTIIVRLGLNLTKRRRTHIHRR